MPPPFFQATSIIDSARHNHARCAGLYGILRGTGKLGLTDDVIHVEPGMPIVIEPYTAHWLRSERRLRTLVIGILPLAPC